MTKSKPKKPGATKEVRRRVTTEYLLELLKSGREYWREAMQIAAKEEPLEFLKLYNEIIKRDPSLVDQLGLPPATSVTFTWKEAPQVIYVDPDGSQYEKSWDGKRIPVIEAEPPEVKQIIKYEQ